jgi:hypothetical protein
VGGGDAAASVIGAAVLVAASPADLAVFLPADICGFPYRLSLRATISSSSRLSWLFSSWPLLTSVKG